MSDVLIFMLALLGAVVIICICGVWAKRPARPAKQPRTRVDVLINVFRKDNE